MENLDVIVTDEVISQIRKSIELEGNKRLDVKMSGSFSACCGMRYSLTLEEGGEEDIVVKVRGIDFFVQQVHGRGCGGSFIDYAEGDGEAGFILYSNGPGCGREAC